MKTAVVDLLDRTQRSLLARAGLLSCAVVLSFLVQGRYSALRLFSGCDFECFWRLRGELVAFFAVLVILGWRALAGWPASRSPAARQVQAFELGAMLLVCVHVLIQAAGGPQSALQPLTYAAVLYVVGFNDRWTSVALVLLAMVLQLALLLSASSWDLDSLWPAALAQSAFIALFAVGGLLFVRLEVVRRRAEHTRRLTEALRRMREEARDFRLIGTSIGSRAEERGKEEAKLARGALDAIHSSMFFVLELLKKSLELQTCVLLWLDSSGRELRIKEMLSDSQLIVETPIPAQAGALGGIVKNRLLLNLRRPRGRGIPYYGGPEHVGAFAGVPVIEEGHLRGVLCADRREDRPFSASDEKLLIQAAEQILRAIQTERVLTAVERSKYEHERFHRASTMLNEALTLEQVLQQAMAAAREVIGFDFAAITLYEPQRRKHRICRIWEPQLEGRQSDEPAADDDGAGESANKGARQLEGAEFGDNAGLVAMVVKNKHFLPAGPTGLDHDTVVFTRRLRFELPGSLLVLPLIIKDQAIGTFVLAAKLPGRFPQHVRDMLGVISNQVAVAIENAKMYRRMEEMATTDGLTNLPNHRTFQARFSEMLARAERRGKPVSLVLTDVDRFKSINDTYGHPVGDQVLKRVASALAEHIRKVDLVARYGGEEFAIVLEETDSRGAHLLCERVRQHIAAQVLSSDKGGFRVTISLGIASYPADGLQKETLVERADQALYHAKHTGRNRTVCYADGVGSAKPALASAGR